MSNVASTNEPRNGYGKFAAQRDLDLIARLQNGTATAADHDRWAGYDNVVPLHPPAKGRGDQANGLSLAALADEQRWVGYQIEERNGGLTKVPKNPKTGGNAMVPTEPETYGTRAEAEQRAEQIKKKNEGGFGIVLGGLPNGYYLIGIDLNSCLGGGVMIAEWAAEVLTRFATYAEVSPSGTGIKLFFLMTTEDYNRLLQLLGPNKTDGKQLIRKTFAAGEHREVAIDTARFYAVTEERLNENTPECFRLVAFADVEWFIKEVGPQYLAQQRTGNGHADSGKSGLARFAAERRGQQYDESGSGYGWRYMRHCKADGMSYETARLAILADATEAGEWANRVDERQLQRAYEAEKKKGTETGKANAEPLPELQSYFLEELQERPVVLLQWIVEDFILAGKVNGLFGDGGVGKDLLLLQLAIAMTCGGTWLGHEVKQGRVMYFVVEDDDDELRRREDNITYYLKQVLGKYQPLPKQLKIVPLVGEETVLAVFDHKTGRVQPTELFIQIYNMIEEFQPDVVIVGNRVDIFSVNQNDDAQAKQCMQLLTKICKHLQTTVIMPGHVSIGGKTAGTSGSVQWSNACRHRIYLRRVKDEKTGEEDDPNLRELEVMKTNHGMTGKIITMRWIDGVFKTDHVAVVSELEEKGADVADDNEVLRLLDELIEGDSVSPSENSKTYFGKKFLKGRFRGRNGGKRLEEAVKRLHSRNVIKTIFTGSPTRPTAHLVRREFAPNQK